MKSKIKILISNDDGIHAAGIRALADAFYRDFDVTVVAPQSERSASSHALSSMYSITYKKEEQYPYTAYSCSGTPADCVKLAALHLSKDKPFDLVLSGINNGRNLGSDVIYSGTVSAAFEGVYLGISAIAISTDHNAPYEKIMQVALFVKNNLKKLLDLNIPKTSALNINYPLKTPVKGAKLTKLGIHLYGDGFFKVQDGYQLQGSPLPLKEDQGDCDIHWFKEGYIAITPIQNDRNDYFTLKRIQGDFIPVKDK